MPLCREDGCDEKTAISTGTYEDRPVLQEFGSRVPSPVQALPEIHSGSLDPRKAHKTRPFEASVDGADEKLLFGDRQGDLSVQTFLEGCDG
jgi:hypothetical protein